MYYFEEDTADSAIKLAEKKLGQGQVVVFRMTDNASH